MPRQFLLIAVCVLLSACTARYQFVGSFDNYDEVFRGDIDANLANGTARIFAKGENTGLSCHGSAHVTYVPPFSVGCFGQQGEGRLTCDDGRLIALKYDVDTCTSGSGYGTDNKGNTFNFVFGLNGEEADRKLAELRPQVANKPKLPGYKPKETREKQGFSIGTFFFVSDQGYAITNYHVIDGAKEIALRLENGETHKAKVVITDPANDVALIKIDAKSVPLPLAKSTDVERGSEVLALGYPFINLQGQAQKATFGRVNALSGLGDDFRFFQIDVPIQPGNSGGPLIDDSGNVIGIVSMTLNGIATLAATGRLPQNVNFAVKSAYVIPLLESKLGGNFKPSTNHKKLEMTQVVKKCENSVGIVIAR